LLLERRRLGRNLLRSPPDVFVGVDAPDFNLVLEARLRRARVHRRSETRPRRGTLVNVAVVHPAAREERALVSRAFAEIDHLVAGIGQIGTGENGLDPGPGRGFRSVYGLDACMGMGRAQDLSVEQTGQSSVAAVQGAPGDFVDPVVADGAGAADFIAPGGRHGVPPRWG